MSTHFVSMRHRLGLVTIIAAAYFVTGKLGLLLAIPPGYATAVWPASGIALASVLLLGGRIWPGIWLGSLAINVWTQLDPSSPGALIGSLILPALIASGAAAQALIGAALIRRFVGYRNILEQELEVIRLLALGGPLACLIAATVGVGGLWLTGAISSDTVLFNWWTWWVGDSIGVLIFTPAILIWSVRPHRIWLRQQLAATVPLFVLFGVVVAVFFAASAREQSRLEADFQVIGDQATQKLRTELDGFDVALAATAGLFIGSDEVTAREFDNFAELMLKKIPDIFAISWNVPVTEADRLSFENRVRAAGFNDFRIIEPDVSGVLGAAAPRDEHVVVAFIKYADDIPSAQGLDIAFDPIRASALRRAVETGRSAATEPVMLIGGQERAEGLLIALPVFKPDSTLHGFATLVVRHQHLFADMLRDLSLRGIELRVIDRAAPAERQRLFGPDRAIKVGDLHYSTAIEVGQRHWELQFVLPAAYLIAHRPWQTWLVLAGGLLLAALLGILILILVGRNAKVEARVVQRTRELQASEERFRGLVESAPDAIVIIGESHRIELVNSQTEKMFGHDRAELIGEPVQRFIPRWPAGIVEQDAEPAGPADETLYGIRRDGARFPVEITRSPLHPQDPRTVISSIRDISARKQAETELRHTLSVLSATLESTADGVLVMDLAGTIVRYNQKFLEMWSLSKLVAQAGRADLFLAAIQPQLLHNDQLLARLRALHAAPQTESVDLLYFNDGKVFECYSRCHNIGGDIVGRVWSFRDVTQRRAAERALKASEARYKAAEEVQRAIVSGVVDAVIATDDAGIISSFNSAAERMFEWAARDMLGRSLSELFPPQVEFPDLLRLLSSENRLGTRIESTGVRRNGSSFPIDIALNRLPLADRQGYVAVISDISDRKRAEAHIQHLAHHDTLTGLPNRALLQDRLTMSFSSAERNDHGVSVMMLDLDHFKRINDSLGHEIGDQLLCIIADRLRACVRKSDTVARMGGDEFVIILTDVESRAAVEKIADTIIRQVSLPMTLGKHDLVITPSIGLCLYPDDGRDGLSLLKSADTAMYQAKSRGRGHYAWFNYDMLRAPEEHLLLTNAMHRALEREEFSLLYQPMVDLQSLRIVGVEALLRWAHPAKGALLPSSFVHLAEESGMIAQIGEWVLRRACIDVRRLEERLGQTLTLAVNVSPRQIRQRDIVSIVQRALHDSAMRPASLTLEITESLLLERGEDTIATLEQLRQLGVSLAVDDFGTGYSSLSYLTRFPIDKLKIDGSFIRDLGEDSGDAAVVSAIIALAKTLSMTVIAEGVETGEQLRYLRERGCDEVQGFYLSEPVSLDQIPAMTQALRVLRESLAKSQGHAQDDEVVRP